MTSTDPTTPEQLQKAAEAAHANLPDHCAFVLVVFPFSTTDVVKTRYITNVKEAEAARIFESMAEQTKHLR